LEEQTLVSSLKIGDPSAQARFFKQYRPDLIRAASYVLGYRDSDVEDVVQETFELAFQKMQSFEFRGQGSLFGWLRQICLYRAFERVRRRHRQLAILDQDFDALSQKLSRQRHQTEQAHQHQQALLSVVTDAIKAFAEPCRSLLTLRGLKNYSYAQMAETLKMPLGSVMGRLSRCRQALKEQLQSLLAEGQ
jgi:RNA polymerase sigma-70 factor (ECF subfamily)